MGSETLSLLVVAIVLIVVILVFIRISLYVRKHGGSLTTIMFASTYEFYNKDKRAAIEQIVEVNANKKMEEQSSDKPIDE